MSEREHSDGRCCENGYFGTQHACMKQEPMTPKRVREWWITSLENNDDGPDVLIEGPNADQVHVVEASRLREAEASLAEATKLNDEYRQVLLVEGAAAKETQAKLEAAERERDEWKAETENRNLHYNNLRDSLTAQLTEARAEIKALHELTTLLEKQTKELMDLTETSLTKQKADRALISQLAAALNGCHQCWETTIEPHPVETALKAHADWKGRGE